MSRLQGTSHIYTAFKKLIQIFIAGYLWTVSSLTITEIKG